MFGIHMYPGPWEIEAPPPGLAVPGPHVHAGWLDDKGRLWLSGLEMDKLVEYFHEELNRRALDAIHLEADDDLTALQALCGETWKTEEDSWQCHVDQFNGVYQGKPSVGKYRILVTLRLAVELFERADVAHFHSCGTVRCHLSEIPEVWTLCEDRREWRAWSTDWDEWQAWSMVDGDQAVLEVQAVELALDYTKYSERVVLQAPRCSQETAQAMLKMWAKVLTSTKRAQMQTENTADWPSPDMRPWYFRSLNDMPVVFWLQPAWWSF